MLRVYLAELRDSWTAWLGVSLAFVATNFALALPALVEVAGVRAVTSGELDFWQSASYTIGPALNLAYCAVVGAAVIGASTGLVIDSRRGSLARLALASATPRQVVAAMMLQLAVVCLACALVGDLLAYALLAPTLTFLDNDPTQSIVVPEPVWAVWPVLAANLLAVLVALVGGLRQALRASRIPPVEALRESAGGATTRMSRGRWVLGGLLVVAIGAVFALVPVVTAVSDTEKFSNVLQSAMAVLVLTAALLAVLAPVLVAPLTRAWTRLVPARGPVFALARTTAVRKASRLSRSVVPVMMTIGLLFGMIVLTDVMLATLSSFGYEHTLSGVGLGPMVSFLGLPLLVALSGGVGSLVMMSRQRDAELALAGVVGATPGQRRALPVVEGVIVTVTGGLLALVMTGAALAYVAVGLQAAGFPFVLRPSVAVFGLAFAACLLVVVCATTLPTLRSIRRPEPAVIARLVAE